MRRSSRLAVVAASALIALAAAAPAVADTPATLASVTIQGDTVVGTTLQAVLDMAGVPTPTVTYVWTRCNADGKDCQRISGATGATYTLTSAEIGYALVVRVTVKNPTGS